ncbi:MAG: HEAT repeat domain-containing protein [Planctomycetota bacterium]
MKAMVWIAVVLGTGQALGAFPLAQEAGGAPPAAAPEEEPRPLARDGELGDPGELRREIAALAADLEIQGDPAAVLPRVEELWLRAASARPAPDEARGECLVEIALLRSRVLRELGRREEAAAALTRLLPDGREERWKGERRLVAAPGGLVRWAEEAAAANDRLREARGRLAPAEAEATPLPAEDESLRELVRDGLARGQWRRFAELGGRAMPYLAEIVRGDPEAPSEDDLHDPLHYMIQYGEHFAAKFLSREVDLSIPNLSGRVCRHMKECNVLGNAGTWSGVALAGGKIVCLEPEWLQVVEEILHAPEGVLIALELLPQFLARDALTPGMQQALMVALDGPDATQRSGVLQVLTWVDSRGGFSYALESVRPILEHAARHPDPGVRYVAATRLAAYPESEALLEMTADPDPAIRQIVGQTLQPVRDLLLFQTFPPDGQPQGKRVTVRREIGEREQAALARLVLDDDVSVRRVAMESLIACTTELGLRLEDDVYERLARDPDVKIRAFLVTIALNASVVTSTIVRVALEEQVPGLLATLLQHDPTDAFRSLDDELLLRLLRAARSTAPETYDSLWRVIYEEWPVRIVRMRKLLADPGFPMNVRLDAARLAANEGGEEFQRAMRPLLTDPRWKNTDPTKRESGKLHQIARALPPEELNPFLLAVVQDRGLADLSCFGLASAYDTGKPLHREVTLAILDRWFPNGEPSLRWTEPFAAIENALVHLAFLPADVDPPVLIGSIRFPEYAASAIRTMGHLGDSRYVAAVGQCLDATWIQDSGDREELGALAASVLPRFGTDEAVSYLLNGLRSELDPIRAACQSGLAHLEEYHRLQRAWEERTERRQTRASAVVELAAILADADPLVRAEAARALATLEGVEHLPAIVRLLRDPDEGVRQAAREALERLNAPRPAPPPAPGASEDAEDAKSPPAAESEGGVGGGE